MENTLLNLSLEGMWDEWASYCSRQLPWAHPTKTLGDAALLKRIQAVIEVYGDAAALACGDLVSQQGRSLKSHWPRGAG